MSTALDVLADPALSAAHRERLFARTDRPGRLVSRAGRRARYDLLDPGRLIRNLTFAEVATLTGVSTADVYALALRRNEQP